VASSCRADRRMGRRFTGDRPLVGSLQLPDRNRACSQYLRMTLGGKAFPVRRDRSDCRGSRRQPYPGDRGEGQDIAELTVGISGPGFERFDADCEVPTGNVRPQVGDRRTV